MAAAALICALNDVIIFILTTLGSGRGSDAVKYDNECENISMVHVCVCICVCAALRSCAVNDDADVARVLFHILAETRPQATTQPVCCTPTPPYTLSPYQ